VLRITSTKAVEGQQAMTKQEALNVIRRMPKEQRQNMQLNTNNMNQQRNK